MRLKDKVAIVTGGTLGIGKAAALLFAKEGALVTVVGYKHVDEGRDIVSSIEKNGGKAIFVKADVSNEKDIKSIVKGTVKAFGKIDIVFSNAGIILPKSATDTSIEEWDRIMGVNLKSAFLLCKYSIPVMKENGGGSIVIDSSVNGLMAEPDIAAYCTTKAGLFGLTRSMSVDYGKDNIRVNCVAPGWIETPMNEDYFAVSGNREKAAALHSLGKVGTPEEVANAVLFLASDEASFITGSTLTVDGGLTSAFSTVF